MGGLGVIMTYQGLESEFTSLQPKQDSFSPRIFLEPYIGHVCRVNLVLPPKTESILWII